MAFKFFFPFLFFHENYCIKNICVYSKSKLKTIITKRSIVDVAAVLDPPLKGQLFFVWVFVFFVSTNFLIHSYLVHKSKNKKTITLS